MFRFIRAFNHEIAIQTVDHSSFSYIKESDSERELKIGKLIVYISKTDYQTLGILIE